MLYVQLLNGRVHRYPYSIRQFQIDNPGLAIADTITDAELAAYDIYPVMMTEFPAHDQRSYNVEQLEPEFVDGTWRQRFLVSQLPVDQAAQRHRNARNKLLLNSDWTQGKDIPDTISAPWAQYRQQLRELPLADGFPYSHLWPVPPE